MDLEAILRRIRKLLAIAQDGRGDPNEAAAAAAQADKLMRKFNIDHADLLREQLKANGAGMATYECSANMKRGDPKRPPLKRNPLWAGWLGIRVANLNDCRVRFVNTPSGAMVQFCGTQLDVQAAGFMFDYLVGQLIKACRAFNSETLRTKAQSDSYRKAFVIALCDKLTNMKEEREAELKRGAATGATSSALALVNEKAKAIEEHFGKIKYTEGREVSMSDHAATMRGFSDGHDVDVNVRGVGADPQAQVLLLG